MNDIFNFINKINHYTSLNKRIFNSKNVEGDVRMQNYGFILLSKNT